MVKDWIFYPLAGLIGLAMIGIALSFAETTDLSDKTIWENGYVMEGTDLSRLTAQPGTQANFNAALGGEPAFARLNSTSARANLPMGPGVFAPIGPEYERAFANCRLRLTITARPSRINPLSGFDMAYWTIGSRNTGWVPKTLEPGWNDYVLEFNPGPLKSAPDLDYFSIWPGLTAEPLSMDVMRMRIEVLETPEKN